MDDLKGSPHKITVSVAISGHDMPAFGGYHDKSVHEPVKEGALPRGKILLNLDAMMYACVDNPDININELAADCITHELVHAIQDYFCNATTEYGLEEAIMRARGYADECGMPTPEDDLEAAASLVRGWSCLEWERVHAGHYTSHGVGGARYTALRLNSRWIAWRTEPGAREAAKMRTLREAKVICDMWESFEMEWRGSKSR